MVDHPEHTSPEASPTQGEAAEPVFAYMRTRMRNLAEQSLTRSRGALDRSSHRLKTGVGSGMAAAGRGIAAHTSEAGRAVGDMARTHLLPVLRRWGENLAQRTNPVVLKEDYRRILMFIHETVLDRDIEQVLFVPTRDHIPLSELTIRSLMRLSGHDYKPTPAKVFGWAMTPLGDGLNRMTFVDIGAGRGRVLLLASHYGFEKIVGVEFAEELHSDCQMNIAQYPRSRMKCRDVECVLEDATHLEIPDQSAVFYFFDPFDPPILDEVLTRIARAFVRHGRPQHLVFVDPPDPALMKRWTIFEPVPLERFVALKIKLFSPYDIAVYRTTDKSV